MSEQNRLDASECIAEALASRYFDYGVGAQRQELDEGRVVGDIAIAALIERGWALVGSEQAARQAAMDKHLAKAQGILDAANPDSETPDWWTLSDEDFADLRALLDSVAAALDATEQEDTK